MSKDAEKQTQVFPLVHCKVDRNDGTLLTTGTSVFETSFTHYTQTAQTKVKK